MLCALILKYVLIIGVGTSLYFFILTGLGIVPPGLPKRNL